MRKKLISLVAATAFVTASIVPASAGGWYYYPTPHGGGGLGAGGWIVGGIALSAASLIACAAIVSKKYNRELTQQEAWTSAVIPFGCLLVPPKEQTVVAVRARG